MKKLGQQYSQARITTVRLGQQKQTFRTSTLKLAVKNDKIYLNRKRKHRSCMAENYNLEGAGPHIGRSSKGRVSDAVKEEKINYIPGP